MLLVLILFAIDDFDKKTEPTSIYRPPIGTPGRPSVFMEMKHNRKFLDLNVLNSSFLELLKELDEMHKTVKQFLKNRGLNNCERDFCNQMLHDLDQKIGRIDLGRQGVDF